MQHSFGVIVKDFRERKGLTQLQLSVLTKGKVSTSTISMAELTPEYVPRFWTLVALYKVMDVPFDDIVKIVDGSDEDS